MKNFRLSGSSKKHKETAAQLGPLSVALLTVSDTRTESTDVNAQYLREAIQKGGHEVTAYMLIRDEPEQLLSALKVLSSGSAQFILINGGTGVSKRDNTFDVLSEILEKDLPGFGELFRFLSYDQIGSAAMLTRATAGLYSGCVIFSMPGSPNAVKLAWEQLIKPELKHLAYELGKT
jgi:molybdenum cofactor biosynthesis protein B